MIIDTFSRLPLHEQSRIIEMAWEDRTPFEAIELQFGFAEKEVIQIMQHQLKLASFRNWRVRVRGRATKHTALRDPMCYAAIVGPNTRFDRIRKGSNGENLLTMKNR